MKGGGIKGIIIGILLWFFDLVGELLSLFLVVRFE